MEMENKKNDVIDFGKIFKLFRSKKKTFFMVWIITFVLSCLWILPQPRYYDASLSLAPEMAGEDVAGDLGSIASSFGINLGGGGNDAIYPLLYPDIMENNEFIVSLFSIRVKTLDGTIDTNLYDYLAKHQKKAFYEVPIDWCKHMIAQIMPEPDLAKMANSKSKNKGINPFLLDRKQTAIVKKLKKSIGCAVDKKTDVISLSFRAQDAYIAATMVDSLSAHLQKFITDYRTRKARVDLEYYTRLSREAKERYEKARRIYGGYADANTDITLPSFQAKQEDLENDMQLRYNTYTAMQTQLEAAKAKVQERTPAFTTLVSPTVPIKPAGPKRMIFVAAMLILMTFITMGRLLFKEKEKNAEA